MSSSAIPIPTFSSSSSLQALLTRPKLKWNAIVSTLNVESFAILAGTRNILNKFHVDPFVEGVVNCRFGVECDRKDCTFYHPGGRAIDYDVEPQEDSTASTDDVSPTSPAFDDSLVTAPAPVSYLFDASAAPVSTDNVSPSLSYSSPTSSESTSPSLSPIESPHAVARPCRYGNGCLNPSCPYLHPVLPHSASAEFEWGFHPQHTQTHMQSSPSLYVSPVPSPEYPYLVPATATSSSSESDEAEDTDFSPPQSATCAPITAATTASCVPAQSASSRRRGNRVAGWHLKAKGNGSGGSSRRSRRKQRFWAQQQQQQYSSGYSSSTTSSECSSASPSPPESPVMRYCQQTRNLLSRGLTTHASSSAAVSQASSQPSYSSPARSCVSAPAAAISSHATTATTATTTNTVRSTLNSASATFTPSKPIITAATTRISQQQQQPSSSQPRVSTSSSPTLSSRPHPQPLQQSYASVTSSSASAASPLPVQQPHHHQHSRPRARSKKRATDFYAPASSEIDMLNKTFSFSRSRGFA